MISDLINLLFNSNRWQETRVIFIHLRTITETFHIQLSQAVYKQFFNYMQNYAKIFKLDADLIYTQSRSLIFLFQTTL